MNKGRTGGDEDRDIADDPLLSALSADLEGASKKGDSRLFIFIGVALIFALSPRFVPVPTWAVYAFAFLSAFCIFGGIAYTIRSVMQRKLAVADRYGLRCHVCGRRPKVFRIMQAAELRKCPRCGNALDVHLPSKRAHR